MAKFNEALKAKREELGLSIADISERTRLTERYIHALEERDIQAFADDLSYLRYFVRSYCDVVGLPYEEVKEDVQEAVAQFMEEKDQELTQTHTDIERHIVDAESLSEVDKTKKKGRKARKRRYNRMDASFLSFVAIVLVVLIVIIFALVVFLRSADAPQSEPSVQDTPPVQDEQDVGNEDGNDTAQQPQEEQKAEMEIEKTGDTTYTVRNVYEGDTLRFTLQPGGSSTVDLRVDGASVNPSQQVYSYTDPFEYELTVEQSCEVSVIYGFMYNNTIQINGQALEIDSSLAASQGSATFTITIEMVEEE